MTVASLSEIQETVTCFLKNLNISDEETFSEYILQLCQDDDMPEEEKCDIMVEFLAESCNVEQDIIQKGVYDILKAHKEFQEYQENLKKQGEAEKLASQKLIEKQVLEESLSDLSLEPGRRKPTLSREEMRQRERLLSRFGYDLDEVAENESGEMEIVYKDRTELNKSGPSLGLGKNDNAERVRLAEQTKKIKAQQEHQKQVQRNKELQEKQKLEKEKEKRRTQKKEKRRL